MIVGCPTCAARYRIDPAKLRPEGARLRCSRCESVFRVQAPAQVTQTEVPTAPSVRPSDASAPQPPDPAKRVLIAHPDPRAGKALADAVSGWGLSALLVHDGVEAILNVQRTLPRAVVLDAALPKMHAFQVCELMKRNEQLRGIPVLLVGASGDRHGYASEERYGADAYAERHALPGALADQLARFGIPLATDVPPPTPQPASLPSARTPAAPASAPAAPASAPAAPAPAPAEDVAQPVAPPAGGPELRAPESSAPPAGPTAWPPSTPVASVPPSPALASGAESGEDAAADPEIEKGMRLARIIVSDVILYNPEKFEEGVRGGNVVEALAGELEEGFALFSQRVDTSLCDPREFLERELVRVARSKGMDR